MQQHASELQAVISLDDAVESIMPSDASCEDIEVITEPTSINFDSHASASPIKFFLVVLEDIVILHIVYLGADLNLFLVFTFISLLF